MYIPGIKSVRSELIIVSKMCIIHLHLHPDQILFMTFNQVIGRQLKHAFSFLRYTCIETLFLCN